jgi:hypothetical protein
MARWHDWLTVRRLIPIITVALAALAELGHVSHFVIAGYTTDTIALILLVLAFLAIDALVERIAVVEKIEGRLARLEAPPVLHDRSKLVGLDEMTLGATELAACGATLISILYQRGPFFLQKLKDGMNLRFVVLDPKSEAWKTWNDVDPKNATPEDLDQSLKTLGALMKEQTTGKIEVHLAPFMLPSSLLIADVSRPNGRMNVEFAFSGLTLEERPHIHLTRAGSPKWFPFFANRFEYVWTHSTPYVPTP